MSLFYVVKLAVSPPDCGDQVDQVGSPKHESMSQIHKDLVGSDRSRFGQGLGGTRKNGGNMKCPKNPTAMQGGRYRWCLSSTQRGTMIGCGQVIRYKSNTNDSQTRYKA